MTKKYDSTVARIAGNIAAGMTEDIYHGNFTHVAKMTVLQARAIVAEVERTEPDVSIATKTAVMR